MPSVPELVRDALRRLRAEANLSRRELSHETVRLGYAGVPETTIEAIEKKPGRVPEAEILEALAAALEVPPETFYEYPIAAARRAAKSPAEIAEEAARRIEAQRTQDGPARPKPRRKGRAA